MNRRRRRGIALLFALMLLTLLGVLTVGAVSVTSMRFRAAHAALLDGALDAAAVNAIGTVLRDPNGYALADLPLGEATTIALPTSANPGAEAIVSKVVVTRLAHGILWMLAQARPMADTTTGQRRLNVVLRYPRIGDLPPAAIVARGAVHLDPDVRVTSDEGGDADCVQAAPVQPWLQRTDSGAFYLKSSQLAQLDSSPSVVHVRGDTTVSGGSFDGILIIDGRLTVAGPWNVTGLVIVRDAVQSSGGLSLTGALLSFSDAGPFAVSLGGAQLHYSPCTVAHALRVAVLPRLARPRAWAEVF